MIDMIITTSKKEKIASVVGATYPLLSDRKHEVFVWFDSLRPINNLSVKQGRVFLGWTSTKLG